MRNHMRPKFHTARREDRPSIFDSMKPAGSVEIENLTTGEVTVERTYDLREYLFRIAMREARESNDPDTRQAAINRGLALLRGEAIR